MDGVVDFSTGLKRAVHFPPNTVITGESKQSFSSSGQQQSSSCHCKQQRLLIVKRLRKTNGPDEISQAQNDCK
jgi:hypothetical protein